MLIFHNVYLITDSSSNGDVDEQMRAFFASLTDIAGATSVSDSSSIGALNKLIALFGNFDEAESASDPNSEFKIATLMDMGILELRSTYLSSLID